MYSVFLCEAAANDTCRREIRWIEEDLEQTRKLAGCGITNRQELERILLPLLPLQYAPSIQVDDVQGRLSKRIGGIAPRIERIALDDQVTPIEVAKMLADER